ncbi:MAG: serine hydrolase domain-containing protein [Sandaracinaceae bacterium]
MRRLLVAGVTGRVFPGGVASVSCVEAGTPEVELSLEQAAGSLGPDADTPTKPDTLYDLAAITQVYVGASAMRMAGRGELDLSATLESLLPDLRGGAMGAATLWELLAHRGGVAYWGGLYLDVPHELGSPAARRWILNEAARRPGDTPRGIPEWSDLGYLLAGEAIARVAGKGLEEVVKTEVVVPLGLEGATLYPGSLPSERRSLLSRRVAPTERCPWRGRLVRGDVHDENAAALGGVAGHAGLFATAAAVAAFGRAVLDSLHDRSDFLPRQTLSDAVAERSAGVPLPFGWRARDVAVCGRRIGPGAFGMNGVTGTSLWCDPDRDVVLTLLTNRISPSRANQRIDFYRPAFHDGVLAALGGASVAAR